MNKVFILLLAVHGCVSTHIETRAYNTEAECQKAIDRAYTEHRNDFDDVKAQCESVENMLQRN